MAKGKDRQGKEKRKKKGSVKKKQETPIITQS
jgi:hypothetical protein